MPEDLTVADQLFSAAASIQGTSLSRSKKTLSNYLCLLFPEIVYYFDGKIPHFQIKIAKGKTKGKNKC